MEGIMRVPISTVSLMALGLCLGFGAPAPATASTLPLTLEQLTDASDYIVQGTVTAMTVELDEHGNHWTRVSIEPMDVLKGVDGMKALRLDVMGGFIGGQGTWIPDSPRFALQEEVLVFAEVMESGLVVPTAMERGKFTVRRSPEDGREMLVRFNPPFHVNYDPRFIPHPPASSRIFLDEILPVVQERVKAGWDGTPIPGKSRARLEAMHGQEVSR